MRRSCGYRPHAVSADEAEAGCGKSARRLLRSVVCRGSFSGKGVRECFRRSGKENVCRDPVPVSGEVLAKRLLNVEKSASEDVSTTFSGEKFHCPETEKKSGKRACRTQKRGTDIFSPAAECPGFGTRGGGMGWRRFSCPPHGCRKAARCGKRKAGTDWLRSRLHRLGGRRVTSSCPCCSASHGRVLRRPCRR